MRCTDYIVWISGHMDGTNSAREEQSLQEHLKSCCQCRSLLDEMKANDSILKTRSLTPPERITKNVMTTVRKDAKKKVARIKRYIYSAAAMAAVLCLVLIASLKAPNLSTEEPAGRSFDTPTLAASGGYGSEEIQQPLETMATEVPLEAAAVPTDAPAEDRATRGTPTTKGSATPLQCVFIELPSRDMVPADLDTLTHEEFLSRITREAQDYYLYGGSMIFAATMMNVEEVQKWESQITSRFFHDVADPDTYVVVFCSESR